MGEEREGGAVPQPRDRRVGDSPGRAEHVDRVADDDRELVDHVRVLYGRGNWKRDDRKESDCEWELIKMSPGRMFPS